MIFNAVGGCVNPYPVGAIYLSAAATSPASLFGGTWERLKDRFLLGAGDTYDAGSNGGEAEHTMTLAEAPSHYHLSYVLGLGGTNNTPPYFLAFNQSAYSYNYANGVGSTTAVPSTSIDGEGQPHNNMPPYLTVYMWKRVA